MMIFHKQLRMRILITLACLLALTTCRYNYSDQDNWPGACSSGSRQSPINIETSSVVNCPQLRSSRRVVIQADNQLYTQTPPTSDNLVTNFTLSNLTIIINRLALPYRSKQFHFHRVSEHQINGVNHDLQMHIVHQLAPQDLAVYAILFKVYPGDFADPFDNWNLNTTTNRDQYFPINLTTPYSVFHYSGSLTTPSSPTPCAEVVQWFVDEKVIPIKQSSYDQMVKLIYSGSSYGNWRKVQKKNGREIVGLGTKCNIQSRRHFLRHQD